jgi:hypothetical protein
MTFTLGSHCDNPDMTITRSVLLFLVAGSLAWGVVMDGFRPDRYDIIGAMVCLVGVAVIMYAPRPG